MIRASLLRIAPVFALAFALAACQDDNDGTDSADTSIDAADGSGASDVLGDLTDVVEDAPIVEESREDGEACADDIQCASGECLGPDEGFPEGMCTVSGCTGRRDCFGVGAACLRGEFNGNLCVLLCTSDSDCREGYACRGDGGGSYCFPDIVGAALEPVCGSELIAEDDVSSPWFGSPGNVDRHRISFEISEDATAFSVVAYDRRERVYTESVTFPNGESLEIWDYANYVFSPSTFLTVSPFLFPAGPQFVEDLTAGTYTMDLGYSGRDGEDLCYYVVEETAGLSADDEPLTADINFYFVGIAGLNSNTAPDDPDFQDMVDQFNVAYAQSGVTLGEVRYLDVLGTVADEYQIIRDQDAVFDLVQLSRQPGATLDDLLRVNVFFIEGFGGEMFGTLGVSAGIPGAMGLHGAEATGLVFSADNLGGERGNRLVGQTLAHELGHFLGLFHTTERIGGARDHLDDTPICLTISEGTRDCPDLSNLMFPIAGWEGVAEITAGQTLIVRANPLTKL